MTRIESRGFTIVELLIVIVVIGILAAIVIVAYNGVTDRANAAVTIANVKNYVTALERYRVDHDDYYPNAAGCVGQGSCGSWMPEGSGCSTYGYTSGVPIMGNNLNDFNQAILPYIGAIPKSVQTKEYRYVAAALNDCIIYGIGTGANYMSWDCPITMSRPVDSLDTSSTSFEGCSTTSHAAAYYITFVIPGDVSCELPNTLRQYDRSKMASTVCTTYGGLVTVEP